MMSDEYRDELIQRAADGDIIAEGILKRGDVRPRPQHINCRCVPTITKDPEKLPKLSAAFLSSARRVLKQDAEIFRRAAEGSEVAKAVIGLTMSRAKFTRN